MINKIKIKNFKCFKNLELDIKPLTILAGLNSTGKSSIIDALLLLRQSQLVSKEKVDFPLRLNGKYIQIGTGEDILYESAENDCISIGIGTDIENGSEHEWQWKVYPGKGQSLLEQKLDVNNTGVDEEICKISLLDVENPEHLKFACLSAERIGPRTSFEMSEESLDKSHEIGIWGEYASHYLDVMGAKQIPVAELSIAEDIPLDINSQVKAWMGKIVSPGIGIITKSDRDFDSVKLRYQYEKARNPISREHRPINVGFGITYTLPIIVAILAAQKGALLLIENPEAHLHPKGQAELGMLMSRAAQNGVQMIIETHSDHLINGIRVAVREKLIEKEKVTINFFSNSVTLNGSCAEKLNINENGKIDSWPADFMSEWENSLMKLI